MIWIPEAPESGGGDSPLSLVLHGCGRNTPGLSTALDQSGVHVRVVDCEAKLSQEEFGPSSVLVLGAATRDLVRTLDGAAASPRWDGILVLSDSRDPGEWVWTLDRGAHDVLCPPHSASAVRFRAAIVHRRVVRTKARMRQLTPAIRVDAETSSRRVRTPRAAVDLSEREFELFERLAAARGEVVDRSTLLRDIWGVDQESEAVLDATVHRLRRKLEADTAEPRIITTVRGIGYRLERGALHPAGDRSTLLRAS